MGLVFLGFNDRGCCHFRGRCRTTGLFPLQALPQPQHHHRAHPPLQHEVHAVQSKGQLLSCPFQARKGKRRSSPPTGPGKSMLRVTTVLLLKVLCSSACCSYYSVHLPEIICSKQISGQLSFGLVASSSVCMCLFSGWCLCCFASCCAGHTGPLNQVFVLWLQ